MMGEVPRIEVDRQDWISRYLRDWLKAQASRHPYIYVRLRGLQKRSLQYWTERGICRDGTFCLIFLVNSVSVKRSEDGCRSF